MSLELFVSDYTGTTNDALRQLLLANGATSGTINDLWMQFFTAQGITSGTIDDRMRVFLLTYTGAADTGQTIPDLWALVDGPYVSTVFLLDEWGSGAEAAYSTRKLSSTATLSLRATNVGGSVVEDVGFVNGLLDIALLETSFAGVTARVSIFYDQSSGAEDLLQATNTMRPIIVNAGTVSLMPGGTYPAAHAVGSNITMPIPNGSTNAVQAVFCVFSSSSVAGTGRWHIVADALKTISLFSGGDANTGPGYINGASTVEAAAEDLDKHVLSVTLSGTTATVHLDNVSLGTIAGLSDLGPLEEVFEGQNLLLAELVLFSTDKTADRAAMTQNMADYWGITI